MTPWTDRRRRPLEDLRISVIDKCNFRCRYCMPEEAFRHHQFLKRDELLSFDEIERFVRIIAPHGVKKVRLTGGEPLLRPNLDELIRRLRAVTTIETIGLTTNGVYLERMAKVLKQAGLDRVNVSLDALSAETFGMMNGRGTSPETVLRGIDEAKRQGLEVKVNMVVRKGWNDHEVASMAAYFKERNITLRYIEFMDVGTANEWNVEHVVSSESILEVLKQRNGLLEPLAPETLGEVAQRYRYTDGAQVGFISSVSQPFCGTCTRGRLSSDGKWYTCLFAEDGTDIRELLRSGASDELIAMTLKMVWEVRDDRYSEERSRTGSRTRNRIEMSYIGG
ncbi:MAG: GTP 3',8-cyclase MoaA [Exiguobacterium sp.]|uniref:GTP 3',8-cyclase MoaA n=1 Tax=Exiguobacterium TaxID=33986 RepID=UPI00093CF466|nr:MULTISPECIES: GTP 3',8-cyclase MoaA [Exiguobacterium]MDX5322805.1 GTP 3',8-cyclase MoaA [Exiguobacterium sp.]MCT4799219.1 GTP 3',8-cyclase MoaA [Exiguobacterium profundum]MCV9900760.1 GTP 3',8-cyclase MoaA [Exiguobacterium sp. N5]MDT0193034.1 GTP 3',8-cyclase MoaA [Exiguobacterium sp. BG5(2022)]MDX5424551.1 GTP 3',8-cyclase MoaA [Exiguobacterium sp.]